MEILFLLIIISIVICFKSIKKVNLSEAHIIERLGVYHTTVTKGIYFINPFTDKIRAIVDLKEQFLTDSPQKVITKDNIEIVIYTDTSYQILDPYKSVYNIQNLKSALSVLTTTVLCDIVEKMDMNSIFTSKEQINEKLSVNLDEYADKWGYKINKVEIKDISIPKDLKDAIENR